ncbi:MAG: hypothetical protein K2P71_00240 [Lachnospiraceae bacterium]|nr:hypothetical protein [Lachnospiraceae bacterium]
MAFGADFAAGAAGNLLEQAISGERVNAGRGILGGLSNAVSGAIFGNVPFKNAGQAFGKGALAGAATSGLRYLSDLIGRQPKSGQMGHFPGGAVTRTPYERLMDPRGTCILQDIFGGGLGVRKAYGYRYEMRDPDQPVRDGFDLGDFLRSTLIGGLMGGLSGVAFYGMDKAVGALKGSLSGGGSGAGRIWDYSKQFDDELINFNNGYEIKNVIDEDRYLVQFYSDAQVGHGRSLRYWMTFEEANGISTIEDYMDKMALLSNWGARDNVSIAKIPAGTNIKYAIGTAREQMNAIEFRPGGGIQLLFEFFDEEWIIDTRTLP